MNLYSIILLLFVLAGLATTLWGALVIARGRRTLAWPWVDGVITHSVVKDDDAIPDIEFSYTVSGTKHQCAHRFPGGTQPSQELTKMVLAKYPAGAPVRVYYDPNHPERATIEPGLASGDWLIIALGIIATACGVALLLTAAHDAA